MKTTIKYKVLLVSNNKSFLNLVKFQVKDIASLRIEQIDEAYGSIQAIAMAEKTDYDIIFMDIDLPTLKGVIPTKSIRLRYPSIRIIALSFNNNAQHVHAMLCAGVFEFLVKDDLDGIGLMKVSLT